MEGRKEKEGKKEMKSICLDFLPLLAYHLTALLVLIAELLGSCPHQFHRQIHIGFWCRSRLHCCTDGAVVKMASDLGVFTCTPHSTWFSVHYTFLVLLLKEILLLKKLLVFLCVGSFFSLERLIHQSLNSSLVCLPALLFGYLIWSCGFECHLYAADLSFDLSIRLVDISTWMPDKHLKHILSRIS